MPKCLNLLTFLFCLCANAAAAPRVEFVGDYSFAVNEAEDSVTVQIEGLRNASRTERTKTLLLSLRYTECNAPGSYGFDAFHLKEQSDHPGLYGYG